MISPLSVAVVVAGVVEEEEEEEEEEERSRTIVFARYPQRSVS